MLQGVERGRCLRLTDLPTFMSRLSRQCEILKINKIRLTCALCLRDCVGSRSGLHDGEKSKAHSFHFHPAACRYTNFAVPALAIG
jgi:hypothetical protein